jgi:DNA-3-methyladenine glycosylase
MRAKRAFYARPSLEVARDLIGATLVHDVGKERRAGRIVEVEAYIGVEDQACHARFGPTSRAKILFGPPGRAYVFLIYGMYDCFNVVTEEKGRPAAVLVRALEPLDGGPLAAERLDGPGRLCRALGITRAHNGRSLLVGQLYVEPRAGPAPRIAATPRIGVDYAGEWATRPWRLVDADSRHLSRKLGVRGAAAQGPA